MALNRIGDAFLPRPACGERSKPKASGEGGSQRVQLAERAPHPNPLRASFARLDPAKSGEREKRTPSLDLNSSCSRSGKPAIRAWLAAAAFALPLAANAQALLPYDVVGDAVPQSLTGHPGDAARGRALVLERSSTCILCHSGPFPETRFQGDLAPSLAGTGNRWSQGQLRLRLVDASSLNATTIMPSFYRIDGLVRVGPAWRGKPILSAEQIEDMVTYLATLRE